MYFHIEWNKLVNYLKRSYQVVDPIYYTLEQRTTYTNYTVYL